MAVSVGPGDGEDMETMSDINVVPLVDVMLVLLIIFLIAIPVVLQSVPVKLPAVRYEATTTKPENVNLTVRGGPDGSGRLRGGDPGHPRPGDGPGLRGAGGAVRDGPLTLSGRSRPRPPPARSGAWRGR